MVVRAEGGGGGGGEGGPSGLEGEQGQTLVSRSPGEMALRSYIVCSDLRIEKGKDEIVF